MKIREKLALSGAGGHAEALIDIIERQGCVITADCVVNAGDASISGVPARPLD